MQRSSLPGAREWSSTSTPMQRCRGLPSTSVMSTTPMTVVTAAAHQPLQRVRQRPAAQPRLPCSKSSPLQMLQQQRRRPLDLACSASSSGGGGNGNGSGREKGRSNGISDGSLRIPSSSSSSNPLPVPEPLPPQTRIEADLDVGEYDAFKEVSREYRRTYFDFAKWKSHRASSRYRRHIVGLFGSRIVRALGAPLLFVVVAAVLTGLYETSRDSGVLPSWLPSVAVGASDAASLSGFALSLLLASRTTNSYARWLEAANLVGAVGAASTNFVRQAYAWIPDGDEEEEKGEEEEESDAEFENGGVGGGGNGDESGVSSGNGTREKAKKHRRRQRQASGRQMKAAAARWAAVLPRALAARVREDVDLATEASRVLDAREARALAVAPDAPRFVLAVLSAIAASAPAAVASRVPGSPPASTSRGTTADSGFRISMDDGLTAANSAVSGCERLLRLPIPLSYTRHTSRVLVISLAFLPATLWRDCGWACVPASALVAFLLLGIEEIGVAIEEPFSILPLENMWGEVDAEIRALAAASGAVSAMLSWDVEEKEEGEGEQGEVKEEEEEEEEEEKGRETKGRELSAGGAR